MTLLSDISRCAGTDALTCQTCARRKQLEQDDPSRWYPHMSPSEVGGRCPFKIEANHDNQD